MTLYLVYRVYCILYIEYIVLVYRVLPYSMIILHKPHPSSTVRRAVQLPFCWPLSSRAPRNQLQLYTCVTNCMHTAKQVQVQVKGKTTTNVQGQGWHRHKSYRNQNGLSSPPTRFTCHPYIREHYSVLSPSPGKLIMVLCMQFKPGDSLLGCGYIIVR